MTLLEKVTKKVEELELKKYLKVTDVCGLTTVKITKPNLLKAENKENFKKFTNWLEEQSHHFQGEVDTFYSLDVNSDLEVVVLDMYKMAQCQGLGKPSPFPFTDIVKFLTRAGVGARFHFSTLKW